VKFQLGENAGPVLELAPRPRRYRSTIEKAATCRMRPHSEFRRTESNFHPIR